MNRKALIGGVCLLAALGLVVAFARFAPPPAQTQTCLLYTSDAADE